MVQEPDTNTWLTSFAGSMSAGVPAVITADRSFVTVISGSRGSGGHASMLLEHMKTAAIPQTLLVDLTAGANGISINTSPAQMISAGKVINLAMPKEGDVNALANSNHHTYVLSADGKNAFIAAVERFKSKVAAGRYTYRVAGGAIGCLGSALRTRGINCADFVIKILREAGIASLGYRLYDTPKRVAQ